MGRVSRTSRVFSCPSSAHLKGSSPGLRHLCPTGFPAEPRRAGGVSGPPERRRRLRPASLPPWACALRGRGRAASCCPWLPGARGALLAGPALAGGARAPGLPPLPAPPVPSAAAVPGLPLSGASPSAPRLRAPRSDAGPAFLLCRRFGQSDSRATRPEPRLRPRTVSGFTYRRGDSFRRPSAPRTGATSGTDISSRRQAVPELALRPLSAHRPLRHARCSLFILEPGTGDDPSPPKSSPPGPGRLSPCEQRLVPAEREGEKSARTAAGSRPRTRGGVRHTATTCQYVPQFETTPPVPPPGACICEIMLCGWRGGLRPEPLLQTELPPVSWLRSTGFTQSVQTAWLPGSAMPPQRFPMGCTKPPSKKPEAMGHKCSSSHTGPPT